MLECYFGGDPGHNLAYNNALKPKLDCFKMIK